MPRNTKIQVRRGTYSSWFTANPTLAEGEIGFETDTNRIKIGPSGGGFWNSIPYLDNNLSGGSGVCVVYNSGTNTYEFSSEIFSSGNGLSVGSVSCGSGTGNSYRIYLNDRLQEISQLSSSGIIVSTNSSGVTTRTLSAGNNIAISNNNGVSGNPTISLASSLSGLSNITASSVNVTGVGQALTVDNDVYIGGTLSAVQININGISASGNVGISGNLTVSGSGSFASGLYVSGTPVSLSGHNHSYTEVSGFCSGVAACVDTAFITNSGIQSVYSSGSNTLTVGLSGQALALHTFTGSGIIVRTGDSSYSSRTITAGDSNISIGSGNGISGNPTISLASDISIGSLSTTGNITVGGDLTVNGSTVTANVTTITVEDPVIVLGQGSGAISPSDTKDRGLELRYISGGVASTGFMGYDQSSGTFTLLTNAVNSSEVFTGTLGSLSVGSISASGDISARTLTSTVASGTSPLTITSSTVVNNLNADYLDGQHGSYYRNWSNLSGIPSPVTTVTLTGDVQGTGTATVQVGSGVSVSFAATIQPNSVTLGTDTTGQYASTISISGTGLSITSANADDATAYTITSNATPVSGTGTIVSRDSSGNFSAGTITASLSGNASTASILQTSRTIALSGDISGSASFNGSSDITISTTIQPSSVLLGTDTSGNYVASITNGNYITGGNGGSVGAALTLAVDATSNNTASKIVARDGNGDFSATNITASGLTGASLANPVIITYSVIDGGTP